MTARECLAVSRNKTGAIDVRVLASRSGVADGDVVPFYFQPTLGGSDINGGRVLASFVDYRFRGPHVLLFQESFEHSIGDWPVGVWIAADQGKGLAARRQRRRRNIAQHLRRGPDAARRGFSGRALVVGDGSEGHHVAITISTSVLGGSSRPSLY